jgi:hypothetical protein
VKNLKKMLAIIAVLGIAAVTQFAGCQKPAVPASAPMSTPTGTAAAPAAAPAK